MHRTEVPAVRSGNNGDRLRRKRSARCGAGRYFVRVVRREKRACRGCNGWSRGHAGGRAADCREGAGQRPVVVETVVAKYCDHLPLFRQSTMLEREAGFAISRAMWTAG